MIDPSSWEFETIMGREPIEDSPNDNGEVFINGNCHMFALALHDIYEYPIYKWDGDGCHYFCMYAGKYIDVRGVMDEMITSIENHKVLPEEIEVAAERVPGTGMEM